MTIDTYTNFHSIYVYFIMVDTYTNILDFSSIFLADKHHKG
jgi:hypothetical protein